MFLGAHPSSIADEERRMSRETRKVLTKLRSLWCGRLNSYWTLIDENGRYVCPGCDTSPLHRFSSIVLPNLPNSLQMIAGYSLSEQQKNFLHLDVEADPD